VIEIDRVLRQPGAPQRDGAVHEIGQTPGAEQGLVAHGRLRLARVDRRLQRELFLGPAQLPGTQREGRGDPRHRRETDQPEARRSKSAHGIIAAMKYLVLLAFVAIIGSLGSALFFMMRDGRDGKPKTSNMARALAFRVGFSILLFVCILLGWKFGYIQPTGIPLVK